MGGESGVVRAGRADRGVGRVGVVGWGWVGGRGGAEIG